MAKSKTESAGSADEAAAGTGDNVEQIRDILFGSQMRDYESRFRQLEKEITQRVDSLRDELRNQLKENHAAVQADIHKLADSMAQARTEVAEQVAQLEKQASGDSAKVQSDLQDAVQDLRGALDERTNHLENLLERQGRDLNDEKAGREEIAALLQSTARKLLGEADSDDR